MLEILEALSRIQDFNPKSEGNPEQIRTQLINLIAARWSAFQDQLIPVLGFVTRRNRGLDEAEDLRSYTERADKELQETVEIRAAAQEAASELGTSEFAKVFEKEAESHRAASKWWLVSGLAALCVILACVFFWLNEPEPSAKLFGVNDTDPELIKNAALIRFTLIRIIVFSVLTGWLTLSIRNYNANRHQMGIYLTQVTTRCRIGEMEDYPRNLAEFEARFATEQACREYLCQLRWPEGFRCPRCGHDKAWAVRTALLECAGCGHQASPTAGTIFQDTRQPLQSWFRAMWWLTSQKNGASALGLQRVLGLGSYKTAWTWLHKLRRAMVRPGRDRLSGRVEVDETYLGGLEEGVRGRQTDAKALIVVAAEEDGAGIGRVRIRTIPNASGDSLMAFVGESIEPGSVVHTDGWLGYEPLEGDGYRHEVSYLEGQPARASKLLPRVHRVVSLVKRWILGTHQGAVSHEHLDSYLDEFAFRFNRRKSRSRGKLFYRLVQQAVAVPPAPYKSLVGGTATRATDDHNM